VRERLRNFPHHHFVHGRTRFALTYRRDELCELYSPPLPKHRQSPEDNMALTTAQRAFAPAIRQGLSSRALSSAASKSLLPSATLALAKARKPQAQIPGASRSFHHSINHGSPSFGGGMPPSYFQKSNSLPINTVIRFVPQQTAWIVERMGKFNRILQPGLAFLIPFLDRIAYVKSLKENALEIPSQSAITADNVTLELDGVLYTRVFDAYKARFATRPHSLPSPPPIATS